MNHAIRYNSEENYRADLKGYAEAKFKQVIDAGVRQIAILADDAGNVGGANYTRTLTDMSNWLRITAFLPWLKAHITILYSGIYGLWSVILP